MFNKPDGPGGSNEKKQAVSNDGHEIVEISIRYSDVMMSVMSPQITGISIVCSNVCSGANQRKYQSSASLAFVRVIHRWPVDSPHKGPVTRKMYPFDDIIMGLVQDIRNPSNGVSTLLPLVIDYRIPSVITLRNPTIITLQNKCQLKACNNRPKQHLIAT